MFDPIKNGVRAFSNVVIAVPESVYGGVTKVSDEINRAAKQIIGAQSVQVEFKPYLFRFDLLVFIIFRHLKSFFFFFCNCFCIYCMVYVNQCFFR